MSSNPIFDIKDVHDFDWNKIVTTTNTVDPSVWHINPSPPPQTSIDFAGLRRSMLEWTAFCDHLNRNQKLTAYEAMQCAKFEVLNQNPELYDKKGGI